VVDDSAADASYREVIALLDAQRKDLLAEIAKLAARLDLRYEAHSAHHEAEAKTHEQEHAHEQDRRVGYIRWAVTTLMTGLGVLVAIYAALGRP
jgi:hypothetical protein